MHRVALKQCKVYEDSGVSMLPMLLMPFVQVPVMLGMFFGVKHLCILPLEQFHWSGVLFLPDLMVPDPYYILHCYTRLTSREKLVYSVHTWNIHDTEMKACETRQ
jgi:YidC/Oxa1 family membrane protein insertase